MTTQTRMRAISVIVAVVALVVLAGCGAAETTTPATSDASSAADETSATATTTPTPEGAELYTPEYKPNGKETAVFTTSRGEITVELYGADAPIHVGSFVELVRKGFYDGTKFHRYEPGFVVQGGDPQTKEATAEQVKAAVGDPYAPYGKGGPGYQIRGEFDPQSNPNKHVEGALGMARSQSPDSAGSQFYFTLAATPFLDGNYTVFGKVTDGLDVVKALRVGDVVEKVEILGASE